MAWIAIDSFGHQTVRVHDDLLSWHGWQSSNRIPIHEAASILMLIGRREPRAVLDVSSLTSKWRRAFADAEKMLNDQNAGPRAALFG
jgi:hypothetical protein